MSYQPGNSINSFLPTDIILPDDQKELNVTLDELFRKIIDAVNNKDIGQYNTVELVNGQKFFTAGDPQKFKDVYRKVINFGSLPNNTTKNVAHGISVTSSTVFTRIYATATNTTGLVSIPIPYSDPTAIANCIKIQIDATNVGITTLINYSSFNTCYVVLEYLQY